MELLIMIIIFLVCFVCQIDFGFGLIIGALAIIIGLAAGRVS